MQIKITEAEKLGSKGGGWFRLQNHGDSKKVKILYETEADVVAEVVHETTIDGFKKYVGCIADKGCPLCDAGYRQIVKLMLPIYDLETKEVYYWDKGKAFIPKLMSLLKKNNPLCGTNFVVERIGKKGDQKTQYEFEKDGKDEAKLKDFVNMMPDIKEFIKVLSKEQMSALINGETVDKDTDVPF